MSSEGETSDNPLSLTEQLTKGISLLNEGDTTASPSAAAAAAKNTTKDKAAPNRFIQSIQIFETLQNEIQSGAIFSTNESLNDVSTSSLSLLSVEYHMAKAYLHLPFQSSKERWRNVTKAMELFHLFLSRCHDYETIFDDNLRAQYENVLSIHESHHHGSSSSNNDAIDIDETSTIYNYKIPPQSRDEKIQNYKLTKTISSQISNYKSKMEQRTRLSLSQEDVLDGFDHDSLLRSLTLQELILHGLDSLAEIHSVSLELQMLQMSVQHEERMSHEQQYRHGRSNDSNRNHDNLSTNRRRQQPPTTSNKPMTLTHITQDPITNQLLFQKEVVQKTIFRPSWNQPTMSLSDFAQKEMEDAKERAERQKQSEEEQRDKPRRYEYLVRDGLEDDAKLVDASAKVDRDWDDWKDENPRGSGNKMGDVGDRNI